jgi:hypothetical protein
MEREQPLEERFMSNPAALVSKLWNYCNILRDDGLSYGDLAFQARHELVSHGKECAARKVVLEQLTSAGTGLTESGVKHSLTP